MTKNIMQPTYTEVVNYRENANCSLLEAKELLFREKATVILRESKCLEDIIENLISILDFEFGGYK